MQEQRIDLMEEVSEIQSIQNYQWYTVLQQLVTVAQHPCDILKTQVSQIVKHILSQYTEHVVWQIIGLLNVSGSKKDFMMPVVSLMGVSLLDCSFTWIRYKTKAFITWKCFPNLKTVNIIKYIWKC